MKVITHPVSAKTNPIFELGPQPIADPAPPNHGPRAASHGSRASIMQNEPNFQCFCLTQFNKIASKLGTRSLPAVGGRILPRHVVWRAQFTRRLSGGRSPLRFGPLLSCALCPCVPCSCGAHTPVTAGGGICGALLLSFRKLFTSFTPFSCR